MTTAPPESPEGRYGRSADERADRKLKITGVVLGAALLVVVGWFGYSYISGEDISAEVIKSKTVSKHEVQVHLEVRKDTGVKGVCTLLSKSEDHGDVGRKDIRFDQNASRIDQVVSVRTTARATSTELVGCTADGKS